MRVVFDSLGPGVQNGQESNPSSQSFRIGGHFGKGFGDCAKQNSINHTRVLKRQRGQFVGQREDHVTIWNREDLGGPITQPFIPCPAVALGAMAISARSVCNLLMAAKIALLDLGTERGGTACADVSECLTLLWRQHVSPAIQKFLT